MNSLVESMMQSIANDDFDESQRFREVMQRIALAGLYRGNFFTEAAFYGGTCLRIFHGLPRSSEDMDFSLLKPQADFDLESYFPAVVAEFESLGLSIELKKKEKSQKTAVESAFLKNDTSIYSLEAGSSKRIKIKLEVDTQPPLGFQTENKVSLLPFSFMTRCYRLPYLFSGKMHAFLYRGWKVRVKGRDWFDFEWYVRNNIPMNYAHFIIRTEELTPNKPCPKSEDELRSMLKQKIADTDINLVKKDVAPFLPDISVMDIWSDDYFMQLVDLMEIE